jgi:hypothetical protein
MKHISLKKAKKLITEERNTAKEYSAYGFKTQAKQEAKHAKFFKKIVKVKKHEREMKK